MKKQPFHRPLRIEEVYRKVIENLIDQYMKFPTAATLGEINARLVEYAQASNFLNHFATNLAQKMITQVLIKNAQSWRQAASQSSRGKVIYSMLRNELKGNLGGQIDLLVKQNAQLIKSVPINISEVLTQHIKERQIQGIRSEQIIKEIAPKLNHLKKYQIARIARTEVAKADTAITRIRAEDIGSYWYQWESSEDQRVRKSHRKMDRVLINWNNAPSPETLVGEKSEGHYHAGNIYNCRCVALPIISINEIKFPARVYVGNNIRNLTKSQFLRIAGPQIPKIAA